MTQKPLILLCCIILGGCSHIGFNRFTHDDDHITDINLPDLPESFEASKTVSNTPDDTGKSADSSTNHEAYNWVRDFDPKGDLTTTLKSVLTDNPTLIRVKASKDQALANLRGNKASLRPSGQFEIGGGFTYRVEDARNANNIQNNAVEFLGTDQFRASWEIDLWGRLGQAVRAGEANLLSAEYTIADLELSLVGQTLTTWLNFVSSLETIKIIQETLVARQRILTLTERRVQAGTTTALDVRTARSILATTQADLASATQSKLEFARALNLLMGQYPSASLEFTPLWPSLKSIHIEGGPLELLARRPDVRAAEQTLIAAGLGVAQARKALLPNLTLSTDTTSGISSLLENLSLENLVTNVALSLTQTLFDGGARKAQIDLAQAQAKQSLGAYLNTALTALSEAENALAADTYLLQQINAQERALTEAKAGEKIAQRAYTNGLISVFDLVNAQTNTLNSQRTLIRLNLALAINRVSLYVALGGNIPDDFRPITNP